MEKAIDILNKKKTTLKKLLKYAEADVELTKMDLKETSDKEQKWLFKQELKEAYQEVNQLTSQIEELERITPRYDRKQQ